MEMRRWWITLPMLACLSGSGANSQERGSLLKFELGEQYLVVVRGGIGPLEGLKFLIDTGSTPSIIDRRVAKALALTVKESNNVAFGLKSRVGTTVLPSVRLGPLRAEAIAAGVGNLSFLHGVDAIIGLDVLWRSSFSIDYEKRELVFGPVAAGEPSLHLEINPPFLTVQLTIAGRPVCLLVDTGSQRLILFERRVRNRLPPLLVHGELVLHHIAGTSRLNRVLLPSIDAGCWGRERIEGFLSDAPVNDYPTVIDGVIGLRAVASKSAEFDFERGRLRFR